ncbi:MAG: TetR family transcriptional regulator C-terminal domain-containing protein [Pseudomonadota bacterium]
MSNQNEPDHKRSRIQIRNREKIIAAALDVFSRDGFRGATVDDIAAAADMSKPNLLYYFPSKESVYEALLKGLLTDWLAPLQELDADGDPMVEIAAYIERKIELARDYPRESRLFANEMLRGAPILKDVLTSDLKHLVDGKATVLRDWSNAGQIAKVDPYHLIFAIWASTQHYADFDVQVRAVLGDDGEGRFNDAARFLRSLFLDGLRPR